MDAVTSGPAPHLDAFPQHSPSLPDGCYLINYTPPANSLSIAFSGTLRIETTAERTVASGDLYRRSDLNTMQLPPLPDPKAGVPAFPVDDYRYYLRVIDIRPTDIGVDLSFDLLRYSKQPVTYLDETETNWVIEDTMSARMGPPLPIGDPARDGGDDFPSPDAFPSPRLVYAGKLVNSTGATLGTLSMGFVSSSLRKATVEFNSVAKSHIPHDNAAGETLPSIFRKLGWDVTVKVGDTKVHEPGGASWSAAEADRAMFLRRQQVNFDKEWHYDVLAVRKIDPILAELDPQDDVEDNGVRGWMYDILEPRRQGLMIASRYMIPDTPKWGVLRGMPLGATTAYFRTALHELGHAMGLLHNNVDNGFMRPTDVIAANGTEDHPFPDNVLWSYAPDDQNRLRHAPDVLVRPVGAGTDDANAPTGLFDAGTFKLDAEPTQPSVPFGMPVRVRLVLRNMTQEVQSAPPSLGMNSGLVRGHVIDAAGVARPFVPFLVHTRGDQKADLDPATPREDVLTLFAGPDGDLFPEPGVYRIVIEARWRGPPMSRARDSDTGVSAETTVTVTRA